MDAARLTERVIKHGLLNRESFSPNAKKKTNTMDLHGHQVSHQSRESFTVAMAPGLEAKLTDP